MKSQNQQIIDHLLFIGSLTTLIAFRKYQICRLSGRILELRQSGWHIDKEMVKLKSGKRVAEYRIVQA